MSFTPFIETLNVRTVDQPTSGGLDTRDIDRFRQGVSVRNGYDRHCGIQPKLNPTRESHIISRQNFGITGLADDVNFYNDSKHQYDINYIIDHFASSSLSVTVAFVNAVDDDGNIETFDCTIEPFQIRETILYPNDLNHKISKKVVGQLAEGNIDRHGAGDLVLQEFDTHISPTASPYVDVNEIPTPFDRSVVGQASIAELVIPINELQRLSRPFDDASTLNANASSDLLTTSRSNLNSVLALLSGSSDVESLKKSRSAGAGNTYHNSVFGTDSIAFGGLIRYSSI